MEKAVLENNVEIVKKRYARIGDIIFTKMQTTNDIVRMKIETPECVAYGNYLIATGRWEWEACDGK